ncbi:MAG: polysaccharide lyase, partial [Planctomycetes bacterium]|nr:polysaccharide lyase [Planctomycetota bacterium]
MRKYGWIAAAAILITVAGVWRDGLAREKWPRPDPETVRRLEEWQHLDQEAWCLAEKEVLRQAREGRPYIPQAERPEDLPQASIPAFPGAEGAGRFSFGGRGGRVYLVTSLADSGPGSLRAACEAAGPRIVVFQVAGIIHLKRPLHIHAPYITIAGQSAPGDGICVAGATTHIDTHDVVIRYLRFRRGTTDVFDRDDALGGNPVGNIIIDHCSTSWGFDENVSLYRHVYEPEDGGKPRKLPTVNLTIQWCISSEALDTYHHAFGGTWGGRNTSFHHNLFACNTGRNPSIGMGFDFNFTNNVLFNWRHRSCDGGDETSRGNLINNYYKPGPATLNGGLQYRLLIPDSQRLPRGDRNADPEYGRWYVAGNEVEGNPKVTADNWEGGVQFRLGGSVEAGRVESSKDALGSLIARVRVHKSFPMAPVTLQSAREAYDAVLAEAGATLPRRDPVDARIIEAVRTGHVGY